MPRVKKGSQKSHKSDNNRKRKINEGHISELIIPESTAEINSTTTDTSIGLHPNGSTEEPSPKRANTTYGIYYSIPGQLPQNSSELTETQNNLPNDPQIITIEDCEDDEYPKSPNLPYDHPTVFESINNNDITQNKTTPNTLQVKIIRRGGQRQCFFGFRQMSFFWI